MEATKELYKIGYPYPNDQTPQYVETSLPAEKVADILIGLEFYLEDNTKYGMNLAITEEMAAYLLCKFFDCRTVEKEQIGKSKWYDADIEDIAEIMHIDLFAERERRCGDAYQKYEANIESIKETKFVKALCSYFNDDIAFKKIWNENAHMLSSVEIMQKY